MSSPGAGSNAGAIKRGTKSSTGFLAGAAAASGAAGADGAAGGGLPSTGAMRRGVQSELALGRCGRCSCEPPPSGAAAAGSAAAVEVAGAIIAADGGGSVAMGTVAGAGSLGIGVAGA